MRSQSTASIMALILFNILLLPVLQWVIKKSPQKFKLWNAGWWSCLGGERCNASPHPYSSFVCTSRPPPTVYGCGGGVQAPAETFRPQR